MSVLPKGNVEKTSFLRVILAFIKSGSHPSLKSPRESVCQLLPKTFR